jgi:hypothetical protein
LVSPEDEDEDEEEEDDDEDADDKWFISASKLSKSPKSMFELCGVVFFIFINNSAPPPKLVLPESKSSEIGSRLSIFKSKDSILILLLNNLYF